MFLCFFDWFSTIRTELEFVLFYAVMRELKSVVAGRFNEILVVPPHAFHMFTHFVSFGCGVGVDGDSDLAGRAGSHVDL